MAVNDCFLPTLSDILALDGLRNDSDFSSLSAIHPDKGCGARRQNRQIRAQGEWYGAIGALNQLLSQILNANPSSCGEEGLVISGPTPVLSHPVLVSRFANRIFTNTPESVNAWWMLQSRYSLPLLPASTSCQTVIPNSTPALPLLSGDPLGAEQFCLVLTEHFSLVMALGSSSDGVLGFRFSFDPEVVTQAWRVLRQRVKDSDALLVNCPVGSDVSFRPFGTHLEQLDELFNEFLPMAPDYKTVMQFSRLILQYLPSEETRGADRAKSKFPSQSKVSGAEPQSIPNPKSKEVELLQALAHEVRTPLATIRTLTRLLLKRKSLEADVIKRLEMIDTECTAQIDRFGLIFRAAELGISEITQTTKGENNSAEKRETRSRIQLTPMSLTQIFQSGFPRWQKHASQRNHTLEVVLPQKLPTVVSDPTMLDQVLTGLIENFTRSLPMASHILVEVMPAGNQLKLQLESQPLSSHTDLSQMLKQKTPLKSIGPLLMFQPETGSVTLNLDVTKNLFHAMGGKLVVRQKPEQGEVMTIFLPLH
jgi:signal transduction histidine kinase